MVEYAKKEVVELRDQQFGKDFIESDNLSRAKHF